MENQLQLSSQIKDLIGDYFNRYPQLSINALSKRSGVGASTIRRILTGEIKGDPAPHTLLNLVSALTQEKRLSVLVHMFEGPLGEVLKENFSPFIELELPHSIGKNINKELSDSLKYFIYKVAANRAGLKKTWVMDNFGKLGLDKLEELIHAGLILGGPEDFQAKDKDFSLDTSVAARHLPQLVKFYKPQEVDQGKNLFYTLSESINEESLKKIKAIQKQAIKEIYEVMQSPDSYGEIPYFVLSLSDEVCLKQREALQ